MPDTYRLKKGEKPTLKTIAAITGLAVPTVSRALNDAPDIGQKTKVRVRAVAEEIGYVPNRAGVRLRTGRTNVISLVLSPQPDLTNHTGALISSIAEAMQGTRFHMNVTPFTYPDDMMKPIKYIVETGSADAVIINQIQPEDERIKYLMERDFPFVTHGRTIWCDKHPYYDFDNKSFGEHAVKRLAERGRKKHLVIAPPIQQFYALHLIEGVETTAGPLGITTYVHPEAFSDLDRVRLTDLISASLRDDPEIDAVICGSTSAGMAAVAALEAIGRTLAEDIDVFAKEAVPILDWFRPGILTTFEDVARAGEFLARAAMQAVREPDRPPLQFLEQPEPQTPRSD